MNSSCSPDVSLYEIAISAEPQPQPLQFSPTTFKSLVGNLLDVLVEQQLPATIWLKLPRGDVWQAEIERFCQAATAPYSLYSLLTYQDTQAIQTQTIPLKENNSTSSTKGQPSQPQHPSTDASPPWDRENWLETNTDHAAIKIDSPPLAEVANHSTVYNLPLSVDSQLRREYFVLVVSPQFCALLLAHRPRSMRVRLEQGQEMVTHARSSAGEENLEQKHPLLGLCSLDQGLIQQVLAGINQAICFGQSTVDSGEELEKLIVSWEDLVAQGKVSSVDPLYINYFLTKQIQRQEEVWRSGSIHRRQAESATTLRQESEELLNALRLKDEFVQTMGQELRTPLTNMKTALSLLNSPHLKPPQRQRYMEMLSQECDRQSSLISSVMDLIQIESSVEQMPMEALRLTDIVPAVVSTYQPLAQEKGLMLGYNIPEDLPAVSCVNPWLRQIVINLLHNSIKFTPAGGQVWVRAKQQGNMILVEFRDTGIGIAQADIPRIFDRFYRARGTGEDSSGAGLGLSIVQQLLLRSRGAISVKSKPGEGSLFTVSLPIYAREEEGSVVAGDRQED